MNSKRNGEFSDSESQPLPGRRMWRRTILAASAYTVLILAVSLFAGNRLYDWARARIMHGSIVSDFVRWESLTPSILGGQPAEQPVEQQAAAAQMREVGTSTENVANTASTVPSINVLLLGTDARPDEVDPPRTDTMILLTLDPHSQTAGMLSLPRDLWIPIPGYGYSTKINTAYVIGETRGYPGGGAQLAKDTVSSFIGEPIQYYMRVNFNGFVELVDLIGGIDLVVPKTIHDEEFPTDDYGLQTFHLDAGAQHLDGETALMYVRTRNVDDDYSRAGRQQQVLRAVADKVLRTDMIVTLLPKIPRLLYTMRSSIDTDIPMALQLELANYVKDASLREVRQLVLDSRYGEETYSEEGAWILLPDRARVRSALASFFAPPQFNPEGGANSVALADPTWVRVEILNGTGEPGVAAAARDMLQSQGWQVVSIGDADRSDYGRTIIINYGIPDELVQKVGVALDLEPDLSSLQGLNVSAPVDVRIVVGRDILEQVR